MNPLKFLFAICLMALIHSVYAEPADSLKMDDYAWVGFDAEGNVTIMYVEYSKVETNSRTGNIKITVHGQLDESAPLPESTVKFETWQQG
jgi:hypothetical protein